ncbi:MAG: GNAT family N-acetyltransferase [Proteobacteria bacterium]|nr:GNAT family N-acetyltransferase [Pseudomonadota bacterium]
MFVRKSRVMIETERLTLRLPIPKDHFNWVDLRKNSIEYLTPWEPVWAQDHFSKRAFSNRVYWAKKTYDTGRGVPLFMFRRTDNALVGAITLDNIRRGPAQTGTLGYWTGQEFTRQGYMTEAIKGIVHYAFTDLDLSRIEAACLPANVPSRGVLEKSGFKYEGVAQAYLQINGRWCNHVLYSNLRGDRRGKTDVR